MSEESDTEISSSPLYKVSLIIFWFYNSKFKDRDEWKDVQPIYNSADEDAVVRIAHSDTCKLI